MHFPAAPAAAATPAGSLAAAARLPVVEEAGALGEELALLGEEQAEAREVDDLLVGLDLREVGLVGQIGRQRAASGRPERRSRTVS